MTGIPFAAGEFIEFREPNAAGYGDPLDREPAQVRGIANGFDAELARDPTAWSSPTANARDRHRLRALRGAERAERPSRPAL